MTTQKKKLNKEDFRFKDRTGEELMKKPGDIDGIDFQIFNLVDCTVYILDITAQVSRSKPNSNCEFVHMYN